MTGGIKKQNKGKQSQEQEIEVDEYGTIQLIESLDVKNRKILNGLVQGVLKSQQEND